MFLFVYPFRMVVFEFWLGVLGFRFPVNFELCSVLLLKVFL